MPYIRITLNLDCNVSVQTQSNMTGVYRKETHEENTDCFKVYSFSCRIGGFLPQSNVIDTQ